MLFLADVPGFMVGTEVERQGIIRHGAKMITAVSEATVPKFSVIVRKAYGAGLYAFAGPAFAPDACIVLPTARIAVMGPEAAINAVYANRIAAIEDPEEREQFINEQRAEFAADVDLLRLASELVIDAVVRTGRAARRTSLPGWPSPAGRSGRSAIGSTAFRPSERHAGGTNPRGVTSGRSR